MNKAWREILLRGSVDWKKERERERERERLEIRRAKLKSGRGDMTPDEYR